MPVLAHRHAFCVGFRPHAGFAPRLRVEREDVEETIACKAEALPATNRIRCSRARGLCHRDPVSGAASPAERLPGESR